MEKRTAVDRMAINMVGEVVSHTTYEHYCQNTFLRFFFFFFFVFASSFFNFGSFCHSSGENDAPDHRRPFS